MPFHIEKDAPGDTTNYYASRAVKNPIDSLSKTDNDEAERLYLINCGICHGSKLDGNGPLWKNGDGPYPSAPRHVDLHVLCPTIAAALRALSCAEQ